MGSGYSALKKTVKLALQITNTTTTTTESSRFVRHATDLSEFSTTTFGSPPTTMELDNSTTMYTPLKETFGFRGIVIITTSILLMLIIFIFVYYMRKLSLRSKSPLFSIPYSTVQ